MTGIAVLFTAFCSMAPADVPDHWFDLVPVSAPGTTQLEALFLESGYRLEDAKDGVPRIEIRQLPADFRRQLTSRRKDLFVRTVLPLVLAENQRILRMRERMLADLGALDAGDGLATEEWDWLETLADEYRVDGDPVDDMRARSELLSRVDVVPPSLAVAQAANESAWGTSRFALEGRSLFGIWTYRQGAGLVPGDRDPDEDHEVRAYSTLRASVRSYLFNLNVGHAYADFRRMRAQARRSSRRLDGARLAAGLSRYSERGFVYVEEIRTMIRVNDLAALDAATLAPPQTGPLS